MPSSMNRYCSVHPFKPSCYATTQVHLAVRTASGRVVSRTVWEGKSGEAGMSLVIARGQVTLGWGAYDVTDPNETAREVHGPLLGRWSQARVLGRFLDYLITGGHTPFYPQLAVAPDGTVLAAWSACGSLKRCPGAIQGATLAWRAPRHSFGRPYKVLAAPEGSVPSFDSAGRAYLHSSCSARVLLAAPGSHVYEASVAELGAALARSWRGSHCVVVRVGGLAAAGGQTLSCRAPARRGGQPGLDRAGVRPFRGPRRRIVAHEEAVMRHFRSWRVARRR